MLLPEALADLPAESIAELAAVDVTTARRWKRTREAPAGALRLLAILAARELGALDPVWRGWRLEAGELVSPDGWRTRPGEVVALPFLRAQVKAHEQRRRVEVQADWIAERWVEPAPLAPLAESA